MLLCWFKYLFSYRYSVEERWRLSASKSYRLHCWLRCLKKWSTALAVVKLATLLFALQMKLEAGLERSSVHSFVCWRSSSFS